MLVIEVYLLAYSVPSGVPQSLEAMFVQPTEVSLMWREVPCIQPNGPVTGYVVRYYATHGADGDVQQNKSVMTAGDIIDGLTPVTCDAQGQHRKRTDYSTGIITELY